MTDYELMAEQLKAITTDTDWIITDLANASALIWESMDRINWAGFYIIRDEKLVLGPFQGKIACTSIQIGKGVCGAAVYHDQTQRVFDVHEFPGHIACDQASNSEIVIPIHQKGKVWGVLDIDSPFTGRFTDEDQVGLEALVKVIEADIQKKL